MNKRDHITKRWKPAWDDSPAFRRLTTARELVLRIQDQLEATEASIANDRKAGKLTETGIAAITGKAVTLPDFTQPAQAA